MSKTFAVISNGIVLNTIVADTLEIAHAVTGCVCVEYESDAPFLMNQKVTDKEIADAQKAVEKIKADKIAAEAAAEAARVKALEAELERVRALEAERLAAEEAAKPKPVTGIFVKVEPN